MPEIRHIVLLKLRPDAAPAEVQAAFDAIVPLLASVEGVLEVVAGPNVSIENISRGYTHAVLVTFVDEAARERYLAPHPSHAEANTHIVPLIAEALVVDVAV